VGRDPKVDDSGAHQAFVVGHYKSGSTWLANLLSLHPHVYGLRETHLFRLSAESADLAECTHRLFTTVAWSGGGPRNLVRHRLAALARPFRRSGQATLSWRERPTTALDLGLRQRRRLRRSLLEADDVDEYRRRFYGLLLELLRPPRLLLDKTSTNVTWVPEIRRLFPGSKLIAIHRDGRDVVVSDRHHLRNQYGRDQDFTASVRDWRRAVELELEHAAVHGLYTLSYEALLSDTTGETRRLLDFLGLEAGSDVVADMVRRSSFRFVTGRSTGQEQQRSFYRKGVAGDWRDALSADERRAFGELAGEMLVRLGYERSAHAADWEVAETLSTRGPSG